MQKSSLYMLLVISIVTEVFAATMLKLSAGFTVWLPLVGVALGYGISFFVLGIILKYMPISVAYAIWAGAGTVLTAIVSIGLFGEVFTILKTIGITLILGGIVLLNLSSEDDSSVGVENTSSKCKGNR